MQSTVNVTIQVWYYLKQSKSYIYIYIQILEILYIMSKLVFKEYLTLNIIQYIKFHAKGTIDIMFANTKVLYKLEKSYII